MTVAEVLRLVGGAIVILAVIGIVVGFRFRPMDSNDGRCGDGDPVQKSHSHSRSAWWDW